MDVSTPTGSRGFTYLGLLFFVAITAAALAALGQMWSTAAQREREAELEFRGGEIARAIQSYVQASQILGAQNPGQTLPLAQQYPRSLDELLSDARFPKTRHHLRRAYADPFTGEADWLLVPLDGAPGRFNAVRSRSEALLLRTATPDGKPLKKAQDWLFLSLPPGAAPDLLIATPADRAASRP